MEVKAMCKWMLAGVAAVLLGMGLAESAGAGWHCWQTCSLPVQLEQRTVTCYRPEYRTEWREVERTVFRCVPETHEQEIKEKFVVPHWREEKRQYTVVIPETREETRQHTYTVLRQNWREEKRERVVMVPET